MLEQDYSRFKIAIVDSDNLFCQQLQEELSGLGFQVEYDRNAQRGLGRIMRWRPHIVISDYSLHGMDYFDFASKIESLPTKVTLAVVSSSHLDSQLLTQLTNLSGVSLAVQKPIRVDELAAKIVNLVPELDVFQEVREVPEDDETTAEFALDDLGLQREVARLEFEGKELPRSINSLKALALSARSQPHKRVFFTEALEKIRRTIEAVERQNLDHLLGPLNVISDLLQKIKENGLNPSLIEWDQLNEELENLLRPGIKKLGKIVLPAQVGQSISPPSLRAGGRLAFLAVGAVSSDQLLNLGSTSNVSFEFIDDESSLEESLAGSNMDLVLFYISEAISESRAINAITSLNDRLRKLEGCSEKPLVVVSEIESLHARVVTSHLDCCYWFLWKTLRGNPEQFQVLRTIACQSESLPSVLVANSDIASSEELMRGLSEHCRKVDVVGQEDMLLEGISDFEPDIVVVSENVGKLSGFDVVRAIKDSLDFRNIVVVVELKQLSKELIAGASRAGADGIICEEAEPIERVSLLISIYKRRMLTRLLDSDTQVSQKFNLPSSVRESIDDYLQKAIVQQTPLSILIIDILDQDFSVELLPEIFESALSATHPEAKSFIHSLDDTRVVISVIGIRKYGVELVMDRLYESTKDRAFKESPFVYTSRCYPDDALNLSELLKEEA